MAFLLYVSNPDTTLQQIAFLARAYRAEQAEYLRNHDEAMSALKARVRPCVAMWA